MTPSKVLFFDSPQQALVALEIEGQKLMRIAKSEWRKYLSSYTPVEYVRTGNTEKAIKLGKPKFIGIDITGADLYGIELTWVNDLVYHDSWLATKKGWNTPNVKGHSVMLISHGWHSKKLEKIYKKEVYRHTYYEGNKYIDNVIKEYNNQKDNRVDLELQWSGAYTKK